MDKLIKDITATTDSEKIWSYEQRREFEDKYKETFVTTLDDLNDAEKATLDDVILAVIRKGNGEIMKMITDPIFDKKKLIDWKNRPDLIVKIVDTLKETARKVDEHRYIFHFHPIADKFLEMIKVHKIIGKHAKKLYEIIQASLQTFERIKASIHRVAYKLIWIFPWLDHPDLVVETVKLIKVAVNFNPGDEEDSWTARIYRSAYENMFKHQSGKTVRLRCLDDVAETFDVCAQRVFECREDPRKRTISYKLLEYTFQCFFNMDGRCPDLVRPMMATIGKLWECEEERLQEYAASIITDMAEHADLIGDKIEIILDQFLQGQHNRLAIKLPKMYDSQPEKFLPLLPRFLEMTDVESWLIRNRIDLFKHIAEKDPEILPKETISTIVGLGLLKDSEIDITAVGFLDVMALKQPKSVIPFDKEIIEGMGVTDHGATWFASVLAKLCIDEAHQRKYMKIVAETLEKTTNGTDQMGLLSTMRTIGLSCPAILGEHRKLLETLRNRVDLRDMCQATIDVIDGRSLEKVVGEISGQRKDINQLDSRVTVTEDNVGNLSKDVSENKKEIKQVKGHVAKQGQKLGKLQTVVDETVEKVEVIDHKTLSHAPAWSVDVANMLNAKADHDWRLLASRLGYSTEDIRNWATQPNPCLSMFDEWFATHKTREATYGILKTLVEMDRTDASVIVRKALKSVEHIVEDDEEEPAQPPPVFLSYQWAHQPEVKLLKRHLGMAGYSSWMDIGQMGGGDKLFAKIDSGIRAAKVIVCCVTERYAESPNCNREVNLAVTLGKPIIPLLVEKMSWPPPGSMGPIFGEYIFVRFFQRPEEKTGDDRYWAPDKFTELLFQLRYNIAPNNTLIVKDSPYRNWWQPPAEVIVIKPKAKTSSGLPSVETTGAKQTALSPDIFISYQWDKQPQIKVLYRRLSQLGYTCWLDIMQMGGGDSLYDKIDRGIRGCKVIVSCVTSKYALSANCRREVSLADAIKKPIIPLMLEKSSWPPEGPMGMVFTQLLYIDFCKPNEDIQMKWKCPQFDELIKRIDKRLPANSGATPAASSLTVKQKSYAIPVTPAKNPAVTPAKNPAVTPAKNSAVTPAKNPAVTPAKNPAKPAAPAKKDSTQGATARSQTNARTAVPPKKYPERVLTLAKTSDKPRTTVPTEAKPGAEKKPGRTVVTRK